MIAQAWYAPHPPKRGTAFTPTRPYVHQGFLKTWHANGLNVKVVSRVNEIVQALRDEGRAVHLYVTGAPRTPRETRPTSQSNKAPVLRSRCHSRCALAVLIRPDATQCACRAQSGRGSRHSCSH